MSKGKRQVFKTGIILCVGLLWGSPAFAGRQCLRFLLHEAQSQAITQVLESFEFPAEYELRTGNRDLRLAVYNAFGGRDFYTGQPINYQEMTIDHIIPKSKGGPNNLYNYVPTSQLINGTKGNLFDEVSAIAVLSIVRTVYAEKVIRELNNLYNLPEATKEQMHKSEDPRKVPIEAGQIVDRVAKVKRIQLVEPLSRDFTSFLTYLRGVVRENPKVIKIIGPSAIMKLDLNPTNFTLEMVREFQTQSNVKTEIVFNDDVTQVMKTYPLIQRTEAAKIQSTEEPKDIMLVITRKLYEKFIQLDDVQFENFLNTGILVEGFIQ
ncbi:MAG: HNH endonuclease [Bdellovibrionaceae bacterium]|nr:HNH endonuclease [Pseudobdellovibrionaceae bacterium]